MACGFILAQIPAAERPALAAVGAILTKMKLPPLCRPAGWVCQWRRLGNLSVLNRMGRA